MQKLASKPVFGRIPECPLPGPALRGLPRPSRFPLPFPALPVLVMLLALLLPGPALGAGAGEEEAEPGDETIVLEEITVTATRSERRLLSLPVSVGVATGEEHDRDPARSVADMLSNIPGAFASGGNQPGNRKISQGAWERSTL